jgi:S-adenosylmethionine-diacylgycerolhomoserine-N-methlytransferase
MTLKSDWQTLYHLVFAPGRGSTHRERLEAFYRQQADSYDAFRCRLLHGRQELYESLDTPEDGVWLEMGGGTGSNLECLGDRLSRLRSVVLVDLSESLLAVARQRIERLGWSNVATCLHDVTTYGLSAGEGADVITFSYALTMIPDWYAALEQAYKLLAPGGLIGVVDFFVARKHPALGCGRQSWFTRHFWPTWFAWDNVFLSPDHVPYLHSHFEPVLYREGKGGVPYMPLARVPYYLFIGRKRER